MYVEEGLGLRRKKPKRRRAAVARATRQKAARPNERWAMDFMHDELMDGRRMRVLTVIDVFTRECLVLEARRRFRGTDVAMILGDLIERHGTPETIQCDQGTEFTSMAMDHWAYWNTVGLDFSRPGTPGDNARNEAFNGTVRRECLSQHYFWDISEATVVLDSWRNDSLVQGWLEYQGRPGRGCKMSLGLDQGWGQEPPAGVQLSNWISSRGSGRERCAAGHPSANDAC